MPTAYLYDLTDIWNNGATDFDGFRLSVTDTASGANSNLFQLRGGAAGTTTLFRVLKNGTMYVGSGLGGFAPVAGGSVDLVSNGTITMRFTGDELRLRSGGQLSWSASAVTVGTAADLFLVRDAADTLAQRRTTNPQTKRIYGTFTDASNYERGFLTADSSGFTLGHEALGTGVKRPVRLVGQTLTGSEAVSLLSMSQTWNTTGTPTAMLLNVTDTASNAASLLMDLRVDGASRARITRAGALVIAGSATIGTGVINDYGSGQLGIGGSGADIVYVASPGLQVAGTRHLGFGASLGSVDVSLFRDAADRLAQRRLANPQAFRVYNTTDAGLTNFERGVFGWASNVLQIGTENGGTGLARSVDILTGGVVRLSIGSSSIASVAQNFLVPSGNVFAITGRAQYRATADGVVVFSSSAGNDINRICWGDSTVAHPALKRSGALLQARLGDDSGFANFEVRSLSTNFATFLVEAAVALTNSAGANIATLTNAPVTGNPTKWIAINDAGVTRYIPVW